MFNNLTERLSATVRKLAGHNKLTADNIKEALREVRLALLEADVALPVVKSFLERVKQRAVGQEVLSSLTPGQALVKVVNDELTHMMGPPFAGLNLKTKAPAIILVAGLQGSGKTTSIAKLARWLKQQKTSTLVTSVDFYRPAAIDQLETLAQTVEVDFYGNKTSHDPLTIIDEALAQARVKQSDVVIVDTAGRLHVDEAMMTEIKNIHQHINPIETLFVVDSMTGQDAVNTADAFNQTLPLTGVILTKVDGDARGGAALSIRATIGKPIHFIGVGEKTDALEPFHPERIASRILGMGDILTLIEEAQSKVDAGKAQKLQKKILKGQKFNLEDFRDQIQQMKKLGGVSAIMDKLPGMGQLPEAAKSQFDDKTLIRMEAVINSMTPHERKFPDLIKGSRKRRIAQGAGVEVQDVNRLLKQYDNARKMTSKLSRKGTQKKLMRQMQQMMSMKNKF